MSNCFAIASPLGVMDASGTGVVETILHTSAAHTQVTHEFRAVLSATHDLFKAFSWSDVDTEGNVDASSGYAEFNLTLDPETARAYHDAPSPRRALRPRTSAPCAARSSAP